MVVNIRTILASWFLIVAAVMGTVSVAKCQDCAPELTGENRRRVIEVDGQQGIWFHEEVARCLLKAVIERDGLRETLRLTEKKVHLLEERLKIRDEIRSLLENKIELYGEFADELREAYQDAVEERDAWYRQPVLWFAVGIVSAVSVFVSVVAFK